MSIWAIIDKQGGGAECLRQTLVGTLIELGVAEVWLLQDAHVVLKTLTPQIRE
jgi:hypothetical protein